MKGAIVFFICSTFIFGDSVDNLKNKMKKIESEIKQKNSINFFQYIKQHPKKAEYKISYI